AGGPRGVLVLNVSLMPSLLRFSQKRTNDRHTAACRPLPYVYDGFSYSGRGTGRNAGRDPRLLPGADRPRDRGRHDPSRRRRRLPPGPRRRHGLTPAPSSRDGSSAAPRPGGRSGPGDPDLATREGSGEAAEIAHAGPTTGVAAVSPLNRLPTR